MVGYKDGLFQVLEFSFRGEQLKKKEKNLAFNAPLYIIVKQCTQVSNHWSGTPARLHTNWCDTLSALKTNCAIEEDNSFLFIYLAVYHY